MALHRLYYWIGFFFCLGLTAAGVLVFFRQKDRRSIRSHRLMQYFLIMMYAFGFYGIWGEIVFRVFFHQEPSPDGLTLVSDFLSLISTPFLLIGLSTLVLWTLSLLKQKARRTLFGTALLALLIVAGLAYWQPGLPVSIAPALAMLVSSAALFTALSLGFIPTHYLNRTHRYRLVVLFLLLSTIHALFFLLDLSHPVAELIYIFLFFLSITVIGIYFAYTARFPKKEEGRITSFEQFVERYGITNRESEVIREIYQGKTNREIADTLYVTLQTIKDHTHRIYQKTQVKNRTQLASLLRRFDKERPTG